MLALLSRPLHLQHSMSAFAQLWVGAFDEVGVGVGFDFDRDLEGGGCGGFEVGGFADGEFVFGGEADVDFDFDEASDVAAGDDFAFVGVVVGVADGASGIFMSIPGVEVLIWTVKDFDGLKS